MAEAIDLTGVSVFIGIPVNRPIPPSTAMSLARTTHALANSGIDYDMVMEMCGIVQTCRSLVLDDFLQSDKQKLFWIDSDMAWEPDAFFRLLALATKRDVVAAAYPCRRDPIEYQVSYLGYEVATDDLGLIEIAGVGLGFAIIDRSVCEELAHHAPKAFDAATRRTIATAFRIDTIDGAIRTEDMAFFADIRALGHKVWLDPSIALGHLGEKGWRGRLLDTLTRTDP